MHVVLTVYITLPESPQLEMIRKLEEQQSGFLCTTNQTPLHGGEIRVIMSLKLQA